MKLPDASGKYEADCKTGRDCALKLLEEIGDMAGSGAVLSPVERNGVEVGFWSMIEIAARAGRPRAQEVADYWATKSRERKPAKARGKERGAIRRGS
jgi:hypothetical protein